MVCDLSTDVELMGEGWPMVACHFQALVVLYQIVGIFISYKMIDRWDTVSAYIRLLVMFLLTDFLF